MSAKSTSVDLTAKQASVLAFIRRFTKQQGYAPAVRDICLEFGWTPNGAMSHLRALKRKGAATWTPGRARTLRAANEGAR